MSSKQPLESETPPSSSPESPSSKRILFQVETTGSWWGDFKEAFKRISPRDDLNRISEIPCARNSLLSGIASGVGIGFIRGMSGNIFVASNWAVGTFAIISLGTWKICQSNRQEERRRIQQVVEAIPNRYVKSEDATSPGEQKTA